MKMRNSLVLRAALALIVGLPLTADTCISWGNVNIRISEGWEPGTVSIETSTTGAEQDLYHDLVGSVDPAVAQQLLDDAQENYANGAHITWC